MEPFIRRKINKYNGKSFVESEDSIAVEKKLSLFINSKELISISCTPLMITELITGFLYTEGILVKHIREDDIQIEKEEEIRVNVRSTVDISKQKSAVSRYIGGITVQRNRVLKKVRDGISLPVQVLSSLFRQFNDRADLFRLTGCFHSAALSDGKGILVFAEDIGRHNAVDKVIGYTILNGIRFERTLMLVSCRLSSEIIAKCALCRIPVVASRAAATDSAVEIAEKTGITLAGFVRQDRMNVYTHAQRITAD
jgi:FdhD protein